MNKPKANNIAIFIAVIFLLSLAGAQTADNFVFSGPDSLLKNQQGIYEIVFPSLTNLANSAYRSSVITKDTTVEFITLDEFGNVVDYNVVGPQEVDDIKNYSFQNYFKPKRVGTFTVKVNVFQEGVLLQPGQTVSQSSSSVQKTVRVSLPINLVEIQYFTVPKEIVKGELFSVVVPVKNNGFFDENAFVEVRLVNPQNGVTEILSSGTQELKSGEQKNFSMQKNIFLPVGKYGLIGTVFFENQKNVYPNQPLINVVQPFAIQALIVPQATEVGVVSTARAVIRNSSFAPIQPIIYLHLVDEDVTVKSFLAESTVIEPNRLKLVNLPWLANKTPKLYNLRLEVRVDGNVKTIEKPVEIVDSAPPEIEILRLSPTVKQNGLNGLKIKVTDFSKINSAEILVEGRAIQMKQVGSEYRAEFTGAITQTTSIGRKGFTLKVCDEFGNCKETSHFFTVEPPLQNCIYRKFLFVNDNDSINPIGQLESIELSDLPECFIEWNMGEFGSPPVDFIQRFKLVVWSTGNFFGPAVDENEAEILAQFTQKGGRLFIEGSDVSSEHALDDFSKEVLHAGFVSEIELNESFNPGQLTFVHESPLAIQNLDVNFGFSPFADTIKPVEGGFSLAGFDENHYLVTGWFDRCTRAKTIFSSFSLSALTEQEKKLFLGDSINWLLETPNTSICPTNHTGSIREITGAYPLPGDHNATRGP